MSQRILGYMSNDDSLTAAAFRQIAQEVKLDTSGSSGLGVSWVQQDRVLERKNPQLTGGVHDVFASIGEVSSRVIGACTQEEILSNTRDMSPHRFQKWIYLEGLIDAHEQRTDEETRATHLARLPDFLRRNVHESLPASVRFFDYMYTLFDRDIYHVAAERRRDAAMALAESIGSLHADLEAPFHAMLLGQGLMIAAALGEPLYYRAFEGLEEPAPEPLYEGERTRPVKSPHFRAVVLASLDEAGPQWKRLDPGHVLYVDKRWGPQVLNIGSILDAK